MIEWPVSPRIETAVHRDSPAPESTPAIYLFPDGGVERDRGVESAIVSSFAGAEPAGEAVPAPDLVRVRLEVRVVAELAADVRRLASELEAWVASRSALLSPESGRVVGVRSLEPIVATTGLLSSGLVDARGAWELAYQTASAADPEQASRVADVLRALGTMRLEAEARALKAEAEVARLRDLCSRWEDSASMACENPPAGCECPGCSLAREGGAP